MSDVAEQFGVFASHMMTKAYKEFRCTDLEYQEVECYLNKHSQRFETILDSLAEDDRTFIENYISKQSYEALCTNENLYIAGYKDCVKLMRELGVL